MITHVYLIFITDLPKGVSWSDVLAMDDATFVRLCIDHGYVNTLEDFARDVLRGNIQIPSDDKEREESMAYKLFGL